MSAGPTSKGTLSRTTCFVSTHATRRAAHDEMTRIAFEIIQYEVAVLTEQTARLRELRLQRAVVSQPRGDEPA